MFGQKLSPLSWGQFDIILRFSLLVFYLLGFRFVLDLFLINFLLMLSQSTNGLFMQLFLLGLQGYGLIAINIQILDFHIDIDLGVFLELSEGEGRTIDFFVYFFFR